MRMLKGKSTASWYLKFWSDLREDAFVRYLAAVLALALLLLVVQRENVPWYVFFLAVVTGATCLIPFALWYARKSGGVPMFEVMCVSYCVHYALPVVVLENRVLIHNNSIPQEWADLGWALLLVEGGLIALICGFLTLRLLVRRTRVEQWRIEIQPTAFYWYLALAVLASLLPWFVGETEWNQLLTGRYGALFRLVRSQILVATVLLGYRILRGHREGKSWWLIVTLLVLVVLTSVREMLGGMLEGVAVPLVLLVIVYWERRRRLPLKVVLAGLLAIMLLNSVKLQYRNTVWQGEEKTTTERARVWTTLVWDSATGIFSSQGLETLEQVIVRLAQRFDLIHKFAYVRGLTPSSIPYLKGETYAYFKYAWIPRVLWPSKPSASDANHMIDLTYGLKYESQVTTTTFGVGQLPEAYANFGAVGIIVILFIQGLVLALLDAGLNQQANEGGKAIYLSQMVYFLNGIGSSAAIMFGGLLQNALANTVVVMTFSSVVWGRVRNVWTLRRTELT